MSVFSISKKYRLGKDFAEKYIFGKADDKPSELTKYFPKSSGDQDEFVLVSEHRSGRPGIFMRRCQDEWVVIYHFTAMGFITVGIGFLFLIWITLCGGVRIALGTMLLPVALMFFWTQGVSSAINVHHFFRQVEEAQICCRKDDLDA